MTLDCIPPQVQAKLIAAKEELTKEKGASEKAIKEASALKKQLEALSTTRGRVESDAMRWREETEDALAECDAMRTRVSALERELAGAQGLVMQQELLLAELELDDL